MSLDIINTAIHGSKQLDNLLHSTGNIAIIEYNGLNIDGCKAIATYMEHNDIPSTVVTNIVLLGKKCKELRDNVQTVRTIFPYANIIIPGKDWKSVDVKCIDFNSTIVLHMFIETGIVWQSLRFNHSAKKDVAKIIAYTRRAFHAVFTKTIPVSGAEDSVYIVGKTSVEDFVFADAPNKVESTAYCLEKEAYLNMFKENTSEKDLFFQAVDEADNGCNVCNQCPKYGHRKQCPLAQRQVAKCYREGIYVPKDDMIAHQWEVMAARQGYKPAKLQIADDLKDGIGCRQNLDEAIKIYKEYAEYIGDEDCADKIIEIVENNGSYDKILAVPYLVRKANAGDEDAIFKLAEAFKIGDYGLPQDVDQQRYWIEKGAEGGELRFVQAMAEMYEEKGAWDSAIIWYEKLDELDPYNDYTYKVSEIEKKILQFDVLQAEEIAENGFKFLKGYGVEENHHLAFMCFEEAAKQENGLGERGLAICYKYGFEVDKDKEKSDEWNEKAAQHGNLRSIEELYNKYIKGELIDLGESEELLSKFQNILTKQLEESNLYALRVAGDCYHDGLMSFEINRQLSYESYRKAAELGDIPSMNSLGGCYYEGFGTTVDKSSAFTWFLRAAEKGDNEGAYNVGRCYYEGEGINRNYANAFENFKKAANHDHVEAKYYLGECYINGRGTNKNEAKGYELIEEAAYDDCGNAIVKICQDYFSGKHYKKDFEKTRYWGEKALNKGYKSVRFEVAYSSKETGHIDRARELYTELAEEGNAAAMNNLGCIESDYSVKAEWFIKAADRGDNVAQCNIGRYYEKGYGVEKNFETAKDYFEKSANMGNADAMYELAILYRYGYGVEIDYQEMVRWYEKSITKGNKNAMLALANCYKDGDLIEKDYSKAMDNYLKAVQLDKIDNDQSDNNEKEAIYNIGTLYEKGLGVDESKQKAIFWYRKAANKNYDPAKEALKRLETNWIDETGQATNYIDDDLPF